MTREAFSFWLVVMTREGASAFRLNRKTVARASSPRDENQN
jgi:hypothetical protein